MNFNTRDILFKCVSLFSTLTNYFNKSTIMIMEKCNKCNKRKILIQVFFQIYGVCYDALHDQNINIVILNFIKYTHMNDYIDARMYYVPFDQFKDIKYINSGEFNKIYKSNWQKYNCANMTVVLKEINNFKNITYRS